MSCTFRPESTHSTPPPRVARGSGPRPASHPSPQSYALSLERRAGEWRIRLADADYYGIDLDGAEAALHARCARRPHRSASGSTCTGAKWSSSPPAAGCALVVRPRPPAVGHRGPLAVAGRQQPPHAWGPRVRNAISWLPGDANIHGPPRRHRNMEVDVAGRRQIPNRRRSADKYGGFSSLARREYGHAYDGTPERYASANPPVVWAGATPYLTRPMQAPRARPCTRGRPCPTRSTSCSTAARQPRR